MNTVANIPLQEVIAWACAVYRYNGGYIKSDPKGIRRLLPTYTVCSGKQANKDLLRAKLALASELNDVVLLKEDKQLADDIQKFYRRLIFNVISDTDDFYTKLYSIMQAEKVKDNELGYVACLPHLYQRDFRKQALTKKFSKLINGHLGEINSEIFDKDCDIIDITKSSNYNAYNVIAIVESRLVRWVTSTKPNLGDCVIISARIKDHGESWKYQLSCAYLHRVRYAQ